MQGLSVIKLNLVEKLRIEEKRLNVVKEKIVLCNFQSNFNGEKVHKSAPSN